VLPAADDPGKPGPYRTRKGEYRLDDLHLDGWAGPIEMQAQVVAPVGAPGRRPVALFMHGRHATCYNRDVDPDSDDYYEPAVSWPCTTGWKPVPSYRGFSASQELLASQGWITVSIGANGITAQDAGLDDNGTQGRSQLIRAHLTRWAGWARSDAAWAAAPPGLRSGPRPDLKKLLLVGHSRAGAGVNQAALDTGSAQPWQVRGLMLIAPINGGDPAPGVPTEVLMGACDGDVGDLSGQSYVDESRDLTTDPALRSAVYVKGANHNYFNAEWAPATAEAPAKDDWQDPTSDADGESAGLAKPDPDCSAQSPARLTSSEQQAVGATYTAAAADALVLQRDPAATLLDGSGVRAASAGRAQIRSHALGGHRTSVLRPDAGSRVTVTGPVRAALCETQDSGEPGGCLTEDAYPDAQTINYSPHFRELIMGARPRKALTMDWNAPGGKVHASTDSDARGATVRVDPAATAVSLRILVPAQARGTSFDVGVVDRAGHRATLGTVTLDGLTEDPTSEASHAWAQEVRVPVDRGALVRAGVDSTAVAGLEIAPRSTSGRLWLLDAWSYRPGLDRDAPVTLPRFDLPSEVTVAEGDHDHVLEVPISITGKVRQSARISFMAISAGDRADIPDVTVAPGDRQVVMRMPITGNTIVNLEKRIRIQALAMTGIVGGQTVLQLKIRDDEPPPVVTVTPTATAVEGSALTWTVTLSEPVAERLAAEVTFVSPASGTELTTGDMPADWLADMYSGTGDLPLSKAHVNMFAFIPAGDTTATIELPTAVDDSAEGPESVRLALHSEPYMVTMPADILFDGTVTDT
jgi:hypothetical protein